MCIRKYGMTKSFDGRQFLPTKQKTAVYGIYLQYYNNCEFIYNIALTVRCDDSTRESLKLKHIIRGGTYKFIILLNNIYYHIHVYNYVYR